MTQKLPFSSRRHLLHRVAIVALFFSAIISSGTLQAAEEYSYSTDGGKTFSAYQTYAGPTDITSTMTDLRLSGAWISKDLESLLTKNNTTNNYLKTFDASQATSDATISLKGQFNPVMITSVDLSGFKHLSLSNCFSTVLYGGVTYHYTKLTKVVLPTTSDAISLESAFQDCTALTEIDLTGLTNITSYKNTFNGCTSLKTVKVPSSNAATNVDFYRAFYECSSLEGPLDLSNITGINNMQETFNGCSKLNQIIMPKSNSNVISFNRSFSKCSALTETIDLSGFSKISDMIMTFNACNNLSEIKLPSSNGYNSSVDFTGFMQSAAKIKTIDISGFTNISNMANAFTGCSSLTHITLPSTNAYTNAVSFLLTFKGCSSLIGSIDLTAFTNISNFGSTFQNCPRLCTVYLSATPTSYASCFDGCNPNCMKFVTADLASKLTSYGNKINVATKVPIDPIVLTDKYDYYIPENITASSVSYTRSCYRDGFHETICLPFAPATLPNDYAFSEYASRDNMTANFTTTTSLTAGKAYMMKYTGTVNDTPEEVTFSATNTTVKGSPDQVSSDGFYGSFLAKSADTDIANTYILGIYGNEEKFKKATTTYNLNPFRAFLYLPSLNGRGSNNFDISFDDNTTEITNPTVIRDDAPYYDLNGFKVLKPQKGALYIHNGRKIIYK